MAVAFEGINMSSEWVKDRPNILSPDNLSKIEEAFQRGIILGYHCFYCGGLPQLI
jgi:hypothetical protein